MHCVTFIENALFKSSGDICWPPLPSSLLDKLSMDKRDSDGFFSKRLVHVCRSSDRSYNLTDSSLVRAVATGQVLRYLPDHFFPKLPERLPALIIRKWAEPIKIELDITVVSCGWIFWSYCDKTRHLDSRYLTFTPQNAPETLSDGLKSKNFLGEHTPRPPLARAHCMHVMQMPRPLGP